MSALYIRPFAARVLVLIACGLAAAGCASTAVADGERVESESALLNWLAERNYTVEQQGFTAFETEGVRGNRFAVSGFSTGRLVTTWTFGSPGQAARALAEIRGRLTRAGTTSIQYSYYQSGPLVAVLASDDPGLLADLADVLGPPR